MYSNKNAIDDTIGEKKEDKMIQHKRNEKYQKY